MHLKVKAELQKTLQEFLDKNEEELGSTQGLYFDDTNSEQASHILTAACALVLDSMEYQNEQKRIANL